MRPYLIMLRIHAFLFSQKLPIMKKIITYFAAALMSVSIFAQNPHRQLIILQDGQRFNATGTLY